jgi:DNA polymerase-4
MDEYMEESRLIMAIVAETGARIEQVSVDEAYLELSDQCPGARVDDRLQLALPIASELQRRILAQRQLTASVGIAANKMLAKLGSDFKKPRGLTLIPEAGKVEFLRPLPVRVLYGVGKVTEEVLKNAGLNTVGELQDYRGDLRALVGSFGPALKRFAFGDDDRPLELYEETKSVSSENTFLHDTDDRPTLRATLWEQAREIAAELKEKHLAAKTVQVRVRYGDFTTLTRQMTLEDSISEARDIYRLGCVLLARHKLVGRPLRLLGLGASSLGPPSQQLRLPLEGV